MHKYIKFLEFSSFHDVKVSENKLTIWKVALILPNYKGAL